MSDHHNHQDPGHDHGHSHEDQSDNSNQSWAEKNRAHWDKAAATYNSTHTQKEFGDLINKINAFLHENINWIGVPFLDPSTQFESRPASADKPVRILDYACGPGTVTAALAGYASEYVGIDISEKMVEQYNNRFNPSSETTNKHDNDNTNDDDSAVKPQKLNAHAVVADLLDAKGIPSSIEDKNFYDFDLAAVSGGFHHFENVELATQRLTDRLKPGGVLIIIDFLSHAPDDLHNEPALHTVVHHGFNEARVRELFEGAGLKDVELKMMPEKVLLRGKAWRQGFLARGKKPLN